MESAFSAIQDWWTQQSPAFFVTAGSSEILDVRTLSKIGIVLLALWLATVVKDVLTFDEDRHDSH